MSFKLCTVTGHSNSETSLAHKFSHTAVEDGPLDTVTGHPLGFIGWVSASLLRLFPPQTVLI